MLHFRRLVWFIASRLILLCILCGILVCGFYMCLNTANIYIILTDGLEKRASVILTQEDAENLNFYFHADFLSADRALEGAFDGTSVYDDYTITDFEYDLKIEKLWAWPWDNYATCTVVERRPSLRIPSPSSARRRPKSPPSRRRWRPWASSWTSSRPRSTPNRPSWTTSRPRSSSWWA